ncbi:MAG: DUF4064 domain-containing protein [Eggerthellaceae bacterium]|nr:DUF4064 domain-containing protein [Eggerthellaceae bacterium]
MELHWPLILFTTFIAWSAGLFGTQGIAALAKEGKRAQMPALITAFILMVIGGICVFFHLQHWERIFNGFGNPTSGVTWELIFIVITVIFMIIAFFLIRIDHQKEGPRSMPVWLAIVIIIVSLVLVITCATSYLLESRPAWNSVFEVLSLIGCACILGPATFAFIQSITNSEVKTGVALSNCIGSIIGAVTTICFIISMSLSTSSYTNVGYYFDPTQPTQGLTDVATYSPFAANSIVLTIITIICCLIPIVTSFVGRHDHRWKIWGIVGVAAAFVFTLCLRVVFYNVGASIFLFY